jgi:hypothetical protein
MEKRRSMSNQSVRSSGNRVPSGLVGETPWGISQALLSRFQPDPANWSLEEIPSDGVLVTFCCSDRVSAGLFQKIVFGGVADTDRQAQIIGHLA